MLGCGTKQELVRSIGQVGRVSVENLRATEREEMR